MNRIKIPQNSWEINLFKRRYNLHNMTGCYSRCLCYGKVNIKHINKQESQPIVFLI